MQLFYLFERDDAIFERAETGGNAVSDAAFAEHRFDSLGSAFDLGAAGIGWRDRRLAGCTVGDLNHLRDGQMFAIQKQLRNQTENPLWE